MNTIINKFQISLTDDLHVPKVAEVVDIIDETPDVKTIVLDMKLNNIPGQFAQVTAFGVGEIPLSIPSQANEKLEFCIKKVGQVSSALHNLKVGDQVGIRGPLGRPFPVDEMKGKDLLFVGGGIGLPPLRGMIDYALKHRDDYGKLQLLYGARSPADLVYKGRLQHWGDVNITLTVDNGNNDWKDHVGVVTTIFDQIEVDTKTAYAIVVGPPIMIKYASIELKKLGFTSDRIVLSLERMMKCGVGLCGHCNIGPYYVCRDGPTFYLSEVEDLPNLW